MSVRGKFKKSHAENVRVSRPEKSNICGQPQSPSGRALDTIPTGRQLPRTPVNKTALTDNYESEARDIQASKHGINDEVKTAAINTHTNLLEWLRMCW